MHALQRLANHFLGAETHAVQVFQHPHDLSRLVAEREQRAVRFAFGLRARGQRRGVLFSRSPRSS